MTQPALTSAGEALPLPDGLQGIVADWSSDQRAFKKVPWGKAMMWIFLVSDTFIFSAFLISYMNVRMSTTEPWPNPSQVFALTIAGKSVGALRHGMVGQPGWELFGPWADREPVLEAILAAIEGGHPGVMVAGLRATVRPARAPLGLAKSLVAPLRAPEPAVLCETSRAYSSVG